jgi:hypothetical protein
MYEVRFQAKRVTYRTYNIHGHLQKGKLQKFETYIRSRPAFSGAGVL